VTASPILTKQGFAPRIFSYAILLGGLATIGFSAYLVVVSYSSLPYWDGWTQVSYAAHGGNPFTLDWLWKQHNEHRMPIPKLFLLADLRWFHARQVFLLASIFVIQLLQLWLLAWSMRVLGGWRGALWRTGIGLVAFCMRHLGTIGTQLALFIACGASVLALAAVDVWKRRDADSLLLALWVLGTFVFTAFLNWTVNARSVLPLNPAAGILLARRLDTLGVAFSKPLQ
jgi:hypothetical protein